MVYISSSIWLLAIGSRDLSQAEKKVMSKMSIIFSQNGQKLSFCVKIDVIVSIYSALAAVFFFWAWDKALDLTANCLNRCRPPKRGWKSNKKEFLVAPLFVVNFPLFHPSNIVQWGIRHLLQFSNFFEQKPNVTYQFICSIFEELQFKASQPPSFLKSQKKLTSELCPKTNCK